MLISLLFYGIVSMLSNSVAKLIDHARESSMEAKPWIILGWVRILAQLFLFGVVNMVFDYGKIILVTGKRRSAIRATIGAFRFAVHRLSRTMAVYWICAAAGLLVLLVYHGISEALGQGSRITVLLVFVIRQLYMLARVGIRLWTWSSELHVLHFQFDDGRTGTALTRRR